MRRTPALAASILIVLALVAPAAAQEPDLRDPFHPVVVPDTGGGVAPGQPRLQPVGQPPAPAEPLPVTGSGGTRDWLAIAYMLVAFGAGFVALARIIGGPSRRARALASLR